MTGLFNKGRSLVGLVCSMSAPGKLSALTGVRTTAALLAPLLAGQLAAHPAVGLMAAVGGMIVSLADIGGPYWTKAVTMGVATICTATATFLGTGAGSLPWLCIPFVFLVACAAGLAAVFGNASAEVVRM